MERGGGEVALRGRSDRDGFVANEMARWVVFGSVLELLYCRFSAWGLLGFDILSGRVFTVSRCVFFFFLVYIVHIKRRRWPMGMVGSWLRRHVDLHILLVRTQWDGISGLAFVKKTW